jgi:hypothetical protein
VSAPKPGDRVKIVAEGRVGPSGCDIYAANGHYIITLSYADNIGATVEVLPPPEPSWANVEGAVCRFAGVSIHTYVRDPFTWYRLGDRHGCTFAEMCARYTSPPVCLYDPSVES